MNSELELLLARKAELEVELERTRDAITAELRRIQDELKDPLTPRQVQVLAFVRERLCNKEIAVKLNVSERMVKFHVHDVLRKFNVSSRTEIY